MHESYHFNNAINHYFKQKLEIRNWTKPTSTKVESGWMRLIKFVRFLRRSSAQIQCLVGHEQRVLTISQCCGCIQGWQSFELTFTSRLNPFTPVVHAVHKLIWGHSRRDRSNNWSWETTLYGFRWAFERKMSCWYDHHDGIIMCPVYDSPRIRFKVCKELHVWDSLDFNQNHLSRYKFRYFLSLRGATQNFKCEDPTLWPIILNVLEIQNWKWVWKVFITTRPPCTKWQPVKLLVSCQ